MRSREIFALFGAAGLARVVDARGEQTTTPVVVFLHSGSLSGREGQVAAFLQGLADGGYIAGKSVVIGRTMWSTRSMLDRATPADMSRSDVSRRYQCPFRSSPRQSRGSDLVSLGRADDNLSQRHHARRSHESDSRSNSEPIPVQLRPDVWLERLRLDPGDRILPISDPVALEWGRLAAERPRGMGRRADRRDGSSSQQDHRYAQRRRLLGHPYPGHRSLEQLSPKAAARFAVAQSRAL